MVSGIVISSATSEPLNKVELRLEPLDPSATHVATTTSDSEGHFAMVDLDPGSYRLKGLRNGYLETSYGARRPEIDGTIIKLEQGLTLRDLKFKLVPFSIIAGSVRDSDGEPLAGARLVAARRTAEYGRPRVEGYSSTDTDDLGQYRFQLPPGKYYIGVELAPGRWGGVDHSPRSARPLEASVPTLYPGVQEPSLAAPIEVTAGARITGIDITMIRTRVYSISGRVVNVSGAGRLSIRLTDRPSGFNIGDFTSRAAEITPAGSFELRGVPSGSYFLIAGGGGSLRAVVPVEVGNTDVDGIRLVLAPRPEVKGHITVEGAKQPKLAGARIFLTMNGRSGEMADVAEDHTFTVRHLLPERYTVELAGRVPPETYIKSIRAGDTDVLYEGLAVSHTGTISLEIVLASDGGQLEGAVLYKSEQPATGATVALVPDPGRRRRLDLFRTATTDQYGRYEFKAVAPGDYKLFAWDDVEKGAWYDGDFLKDFEKHGEPVSVLANGRDAVQLHLLPARGDSENLRKKI